jgi:hypothetical protein
MAAAAHAGSALVFNEVRTLCGVHVTGEYMALPASQYSVLDARTIERISDTTFRCYVGQVGGLDATRVRHLQSGTATSAAVAHPRAYSSRCLDGPQSRC